MQTCYKLPLRFDAARLRDDLCRVSSGEWESHFVKIHYEDGWSSVALRADSGETSELAPTKSNVRSYIDTPVAGRCSYFREVISAFRCPLKRVRLLKLSAGAAIHEHIDPGSGRNHGEVRLHIPIVTNPRVEFYSNRKRVDMAPGECWFIDVSFPHKVFNRGESDRVHLVIDCVVNDWVRSLFPADFWAPSWRRSVSYKVRVVRYMLKDIWWAIWQHDRVELERRTRILFGELGIRWLRGKLHRLLFLVNRMARS